MKDPQADSSGDALKAPDINWNWEGANYLAEWHEPIVELLSRYVPRNATILEVGAGGSYTLGGLARRLECSAFGIEPDVAGIRKTIELAQGESADVLMTRGDGFLLPFEQDRFDVVYSLGLVEHFTLEETRALIDEHIRVCKPGGLVIVAVPNLLNLPHTIRKAYLGERYEFAPEHSFSSRRLVTMLDSAGLREIKTDGVHPLWGLGMSPWGWRVVSMLKLTGIAKLLENAGSPRVRAEIGFMTYAIGRKKRQSENE